MTREEPTKIDPPKTSGIRKRRTKSTKAEPQPKQKATVKDLATAAIPEGLESTGVSKVDARILERIKKCFARGKHVNTPQAEAEVALRMGSRLMQEYNTTQAELLEKTDEEEKSKLGGQSIVAVTAADETKKRVVKDGFCSSLQSAMTEYFDCKSYSTRLRRNRSVEFTFYGIASNTVTAAMAFEMCYNCIVKWALKVKGVSQRHSYCMGIASGLHMSAWKEKQEELKKAKEEEAKKLSERLEEEEARRKGELERLQSQTMASYESEDEDDNENDTSPDCKDVGDGAEDADDKPGDDNSEDSDDSASETGEHADFDESEETTLNPFADLDEELGKARKPRVWESEMQLTTFRASAKKIADDYLVSNAIKLGKSRKGTAAKDYAAYKVGKEDSKKIDVRRRRIEDGSAGLEDSDMKGCESGVLKA
ncbi:hypothetical protein MMC30_000374 [Trapelia coarctata]|nr:hypothetical protein [Trapelia coarctata]